MASPFLVRRQVAEDAAALGRMLETDPGLFEEQIGVAAPAVLVTLLSFLHSGHACPGVSADRREFFARRVVRLIDVRCAQAAEGGAK